ncbi:MAG: DNA mismatch repair endonuclease MutL [Candidatus Eiseniibacteriota bacterium]
MSPIRRLPPDVANRIAAGEVVERPASLAKELVENALDAGATRIEVEIEAGGTEMIRVSDDGSGIPSDEAELAFERHATSKLTDPADLEAISTLGFRGEALASIAAVSKVELVTQPERGGGTRLRVEAGTVVLHEPAARARGTTVEVRSLFHNTPARRKFLKTPATEGRVLVRALGAAAVGAPGTGFRVVRDGRVVLEVAPSHGLRERASALLGGETVARMVEVKGGRGGVEVRGLVAAADFSRARDGQILLVNGRPVSDPSIAHAVRVGLGNAVPHGKHPLFVLLLRLDARAIDVNVHPTKREVRFREKDLVFAAVREAVASVLIDTRFDALGREGLLPWRTSAARRPDPPALVVREGAPRGSASPRVSAPPAVQARAPAADSSDFAGAGAPARLATRRLRLVGELWGAYLIVEDEDRLLVIDQHAAHERVLYDEIREAATSAARMPVQGLLVPLNVELQPGSDPAETSAALRTLGFDAREGGPSSVLVDGIPGHLSRWGGGEFLRELFASAEGAASSAEKLRDTVAKSYSCKGAVKFNQRLHPEEIDHLLRSLERTDVPRLCPHGRPIYLEVRREQIDDRFER